MFISQEKMTFLTANYGLTEEQINDFYEGYLSAYQSMAGEIEYACLLYTSPSPRDKTPSRMPSSA